MYDDTDWSSMGLPTEPVSAFHWRWKRAQPIIEKPIVKREKLTAEERKERARIASHAYQTSARGRDKRAAYCRQKRAKNPIFITHSTPEDRTKQMKILGKSEKLSA